MASVTGERVRLAITENLNLKVLSFAFALVLYSMVHGGQDAQRQVSLDIDLLNMPPEAANKILVNQSAQQVKLTVRGSRAALDDLHTGDLGTLQLDAHAGSEKHVNLDPNLVHLPPGLRVEQMDPPFVDLTWEDVLERDVPIQVSVVGTPASGFVVKGVPKADVDKVHARGPKSTVLVLQHARADSFDVSGLGEGAFTKPLALDKPPPRVTYDQTSVKVTTEIAREIMERPFPKLAVAVVGVAKAHTQPAEVDVRLVCPPEILRGLRPEQVVPRTEVKNPGPTGSEALPVLVTVDRCEANVTPSTVIVRW